MKVWILGRGQYSDYGIIGMFSSKEKAYAVYETGKDENNYDHFIEPFSMELDALPIPPQGTKWFEVCMWKDGTSFIEPAAPSDMQPSTWFDESYERNPNPASYFRIYHDKIREGERELQVTLLAKDEQHAVKIVNERRVQFIAANKWGVNDD
jgi:hypothetical protein